MAFLAETQAFDPVYQLEQTDINQAGSAGILNAPLNALTARTAYLLSQGTWKLRSAADIATVKATASGQRVDGGSFFVPGKGFYRYSAASGATANDNTVLLPADSTGRWLLDVPDLAWLAAIPATADANSLTLGSKLSIQKDSTTNSETFLQLGKNGNSAFVVKNSYGSNGPQLGIDFQYTPSHTAVDHWLQFSSGLASGALTNGTSTQSVMRFNAKLLDATWTNAGRRAFQWAIQDSVSDDVVMSVDKDGSFAWTNKGTGNWTFNSKGRTGYLEITNLSGLAGNFAPWLKGYSANSGNPGLQVSGASVGVDAGTVPMVTIDGRRSDNTAVTARDLLNIANNGVQRWRMLFSGTVYHQPAAALLQQWGISDVTLANGSFYMTNNAGAPGSAIFEPVFGMQATAGRANIIQAVTDDAAATPAALIFRSYGPASAALASKNPFEWRNAGTVLWTMAPGGQLVSSPAAAAPAFTTRSTGAKIILASAITGSAVDYGVGAEANFTWFSTPQANSTYGFKWYGGTTQVALLQGSGRFDLARQAEAGVAETFMTIGVTGSVNSNFAINNSVATDGRVGWRVQGLAGENNADPGLTIKGLGLDAGGEGVLVLQAATTADAQLVNRPILRIRNASLVAMELAAVGGTNWNYLGTAASASYTHIYTMPSTATDPNSNIQWQYYLRDAAGTSVNASRMIVGMADNAAGASRAYVSWSANVNGAHLEVMRITDRGLLVGATSDGLGAKLTLNKSTMGLDSRLIYMTANGDANSLMELVNGTATASTFVPYWRIRTSGALSSWTVYEGQTDSGTNPVHTYRANVTGGAAFATRNPMFLWQNATTTLMSLNNVGDLTLTRGVIVQPGYGCYTPGATAGILTPNGDTQIRSAQHVTIQLDHDNNNAADAAFRVRTNAATTDIWSVNESGYVTQTGAEASAVRVTAATGAIASAGTDRFVVWTQGSTASSYTLPTPGATEYRMLTIKNATAAAGLFTVTGTIDGGTNYILGPYESVTLIWNGTDWSLM